MFDLAIKLRKFICGIIKQLPRHGIILAAILSFIIISGCIKRWTTESSPKCMVLRIGCNFFGLGRKENLAFWKEI